jgi:hypothetical protein
MCLCICGVDGQHRYSLFHAEFDALSWTDRQVRQCQRNPHGALQRLHASADAVCQLVPAALNGICCNVHEGGLLSRSAMSEHYCGCIEQRSAGERTIHGIRLRLGCPTTQRLSSELSDCRARDIVDDLLPVAQFCPDCQPMLALSQRQLADSV